MKSITSKTEIAKSFLILGSIGFGGPATNIGLMDELTKKKKWMSREEFHQVLAICKLLPGPVATQLAIWIGRHLGGNLGGVISGVCFILPSFLMILLLSSLYFTAGWVGSWGNALTGMQVGALAAILVSALKMMDFSSLKPRDWSLLLVSTIIIGWRPGAELLVLLTAGTLSFFEPYVRTRFKTFLFLPLFPALALAPLSSESSNFDRLTTLFLSCLKAAFFVFGTGLAVLPFLESDFVHHLGWLSPQEFLDGVAMGQVTPGPITITATFIGFKVGGFWGACVATLGMFLPAFFNVLWLVPIIIKRIHSQEKLELFVQWVFPCVIGGIFAAVLRMSPPLLVGWERIAVFSICIFLLLKLKWPVWSVIPLAGMSQMLLTYVLTSQVFIH